MRKYSIGAIGLLTVMLSYQPTATAQAPYPNRAIRLVIGNIAGSSTDTVARIYSGSLAKVLGQQIVILNQPGAGGTIATEMAARSAPDGYTIKVGSPQALAISPHLYPQAKYKPLDDFVPITMIARTENALVVPAVQPFNTVKDIIDFAKANPGKLNMANAGPGSQSHLASALFTHMAGIEVLHVPYRGAASIIAVVANENQLTLNPMPAAASHIKSGRLRLIAIGAEARNRTYPDAPTIAESGVAGFASSGWAGFVAPKGTPQAVIDKLREAILQVSQEPEIVTALQNAGADPWTTTPEEMWKYLKEDLERYAVAVKISGAKVE
jgi:tripartite-type tricarboxylate transporter receptor subunit TctC